ncbi:MAG: hypothetical protein KC800_16395 [Candidatus Eremiobacteraeota bacterium]|nr:hypothetical protein [Candidatus Eremiobacteraeota bacterium]
MLNPNFQRELEHWAVMELGAKVSGAWANLKAPCHEDNSASGRLKLETGWFWCHACGEGCWSDQLAKEYNLPAPPLKEPDKSYSEVSDTRNLTVAEYVYRNEDGENLYKCVKRIQDGKKTFTQARWTGDDWDFSSGALDDVDRVLFDLPELLKTDGPVLFVEGEKDVRTAQRLGVTATTAPQGAGKGKADKVSDWSPLLGREVVIIPDNDKPGREHADRVEQLLKDVASKVEILILPDQPEKGDLSDWVSRGGTRNKLEEYMGHLLAYATPSRRWIERSYLVSAWEDEKSLQVLSTFSITRWRDKAARTCVEAVKHLIENEIAVEPVTIGEAMKDLGGFHLYEELIEFEGQMRRLNKIRTNSQAAREAFSRSTRWDDITKIVMDAHKQLGKGDPNKLAAKLLDSMSAMLAQDTTKELKTVADICKEYLNDRAEGVEPKESFFIPIVSPLAGRIGGGDVVPLCGPPKAGKSTMMMELARHIAKSGQKAIISQLELRQEQVAERELTALNGYSVSNANQEDFQRMQRDLSLDELANLYITFIGTTVESHREILWPILAANPQIKFWLMDYNERLYSTGKNIDRNMQAWEVAKFCKDTATMFNVCCIPLLQTNDRYYKEGAAGPHIDHIDYGKQWRKDCHWLGFLHHPHQFDKENMPREYVELRGLLARNADNQMMKMQWSPARFRYKQWEGAAPRQADQNYQNFKKQSEKVEMEVLDDNEVADAMSGLFEPRWG